MAQKRKTNKKQDKKKKKKWQSIYAPKEFGNAELGESYILNSQELMGKKIRINPSTLMRLRGSNLRLTFQVTEIKEDKALTEAIKYEMLSNFINRIVRKKKSKMDTSQKLKTKDNKEVIMKTIIITRTKVKGGITTTLKNEALKLIEDSVKKESFNKMFDSIISYSFQKYLKDSLKKITPIQAVEIKHFSKK